MFWVVETISVWLTRRVICCYNICNLMCVLNPLPALCLPVWPRSTHNITVHISVQREVRNILSLEKLNDRNSHWLPGNITVWYCVQQLKWLPSSKSSYRQVPRSVQPHLGNNESKGHHLSSVITSSSPLPWLLWVMGTSSEAFLHFLSPSTHLSPILIRNPAVMFYIYKKKKISQSFHLVIFLQLSACVH